MKNNLQIILFIIYSNFISNKLDDIENIFSNINSASDDLIKISNENKNKYTQDSCIKMKMELNRNKLDNIKTNNTYCLDFTSLYNPDKDILLFTDLYDVQDEICQIDIFNKTSDKTITFTAKANKSGFIDVKIIDKDSFEINKDVIREKFYKGSIEMLKNESGNKFYINYIPLDNNSDLYFFQTNKSSVRDENKDRFKLYYFNDFQSFKNKTLEELYEHIMQNPMKRERYINGTIEIFGYSYSGLDRDIIITMSYKKIKGDGPTGPAVSLSVLFVALVIVVVVFIKNTYCDTGYKKRLSEIKEEE
jgi:hypothetical protein